ncbi:hypothetical protein ACWKWW_01825 [Chryseobacterium cucumeris]|uniref:hypothetical protein n=1 Tax=Chryseobacterium cucumeris TaxID=1813611 RepID=UPI003D97F4FE
MISIAINYVLAIQQKYSKNIVRQYNSGLNKLKELHGKTTDAKDRAYLNKIIKCFAKNKSILTDLPSVLNSYKLEIGDVPKINVQDKNGKWTTRTSPIKDDIVTALNYNYLRGSFYPKYFRDIGIKACIYCNSQFTISIETEKKVLAKFELDHYWPKDVYPWLSICLFNLYPACKSCNNVKSVKEVDFNFYSDKNEELSKSNFKFTLTKGSKATYLISKKIDDIEIEFTEPAVAAEKHTFNDVFQIKKIYEAQVDIVEELILKSEMYDDSYRELLEEKYSAIGVDQVSIDRIILGNYTDITDIHKRPLSKFMQDIAEDVGLTKPS